VAFLTEFLVMESHVWHTYTLSCFWFETLHSEVFESNIRVIQQIQLQTYRTISEASTWKNWRFYYSGSVVHKILL